MIVQKKNYSENFRPAAVKRGAEIIVEFYAKNPFTDALKRYRLRFNHIPGDRREKIKYAENVAADINIKLRDGWLPELQLDTKNNYVQMERAVSKFIETRRREFSLDTVRMYTSFWSVMGEWLQKRYKQEIFVVQIDKAVAANFCRYLTVDREVSMRTFNNYLTGLNAMFRWFVDTGYHTYNPFESIKKKKVPTKRRMFLNEEERKQVKNYWLTENRDFFRMILMSHFTILRRKELTLIKVEHLNLDKKLLFVPAENSKNKKDYYVTIPDALMSWIKELKPENYPGHYFLFSGHYLYPGTERIQPKWISDQWAKMRKALCFSSRLQFMSLRDTGIRQLLRDGVSIDDVMIQARHWSLEVTKTYLIHDNAEANNSIATKAKDF